MLEHMIWKPILTSNTCIKFLKINFASNRTISTVDDVIFKSVGNAGVITLNRPEALNAINLSMVNKIYPQLKEWEDEKLLIIINGAGEKSFCAGADLRVIVESGFKRVKLGSEYSHKLLSLFSYVGRYKKPYIALTDGIVMGSGLGLSVHGPYRVATERSIFAMPETAVGSFPGAGGSYFLPRMQGKLGIYLALTGHHLIGSDLVKAGIATHYCNSRFLTELEHELSHCKNNKDIQLVLNKLNNTDEEQFALDSYLCNINKCFSAPTVEQIIKQLNADGSDWAKGVLKTLAKMSPTSLKVSLKILQEGANLPLDRCLEMEYRVAVNFFKNNDFYEGVRAVLIDKDQNPQWNPNSVTEVSDATVNSYFNRLTDDQEVIH